MFHMLCAFIDQCIILTLYTQKNINTLFLLENMPRLFFDHFNKSTVKPGADTSYSQFMHKVIHRFCG